MASITLRNVTKAFENGTLAVDSLSLDIDDGEFMVLVGPSGCGKSTSLRMVAGLEDPTDGEILIGTRVMNEIPSRHRDIAMVFQNYALYPHMSVLDNLGFGLRMQGVAKPERVARARDAAEILGITELLGRRPKQLSGGQRQRVAMGRAIVRQPQAFLMDEPLSNLDAKLRVQMRTEIAAIQRRLATTTLYVTHDQVEAMTMADRVAVMHRGVLQQVASPQDLYDRPVNLFVAGFVGSPPMNLFEGRIVHDDGSSGVEFGSHTLALPPGRWAERAGQRVVVGMRAEDVTEQRAGERPGHSLALIVDHTEQLGSDLMVHALIDAAPANSTELREALDVEQPLPQTGGRLLARCAPRLSVHSGDRIGLGVDVERLHVFDAATGQNLRI